MEEAAYAEVQTPRGITSWPSGQRCSVYSCHAQGQEHRASAASFWRPWLITAQDMASLKRRREHSPFGRPSDSDRTAEVDKTVPLFTHPVRLFWPKSKSYDYLYNDGEILLKNFPAQATINFYNDSDSEDEDWEEDAEEEEEEKEAAEEEEQKREYARELRLNNQEGFCQQMSSACHSSSPYSCLN